MSDVAVEIRQLSKAFGDLPVIHDVSFDVFRGEIVALLGPSGCGKTTLLRLIAGFESADSGHIAIAGRSVVDDGYTMPPEKRRVGMVFQDYAIFPHLSVIDNVKFGLRRGNRQRAEQMLELVGLMAHAGQMPHALSGGQQQRVAIARALAPEPVVLLLDEPFSNLDANLRQSVRQEVRDLLKNNQITAIFVTHDQQEAMIIGDRVAVMHAGRIEQIGSPESVFHKPQTPFVAAFMGHADFIDGVVTTAGIETALGVAAQPVNLAAGAVVQLALRPDDVTFSENGQSNAEIVQRRFQGIDIFYRLQLDDGGWITVRRPHRVMTPTGARVQATFAAEHPLPCFHEGRRL